MIAQDTYTAAELAEWREKMARATTERIMASIEKQTRAIMLAPSFEQKRKG